jgi:GTP-binding protein Era
VAFQSAFIAIVGSPNVGKSTLMNRIVGEKVAIVSKRPQTTRNKIVGILTGRDYQMVFLDTPGVHTPKNKLGEYMVKTAFDTTRDVEAVLFVCDAKRGLGERDKEILHRLLKGGVPVLAAVNKTDAVSKAKCIEIGEDIHGEGLEPDDIYFVSAKTGEGVDELMTAARRYLVTGPKYYPDDAYTDQPERVIAAEMIREKALGLLKEEIPHGIGVHIDKVTTRTDKPIIEVSATIICERQGHKGIIIGKGGKMLKAIGTQARADLEMLFGAKVFLELWVKVEDKWRDNKRVMHDLGYE